MESTSSNQITKIIISYNQIKFESEQEKLQQLKITPTSSEHIQRTCFSTYAKQLTGNQFCTKYGLPPPENNFKICHMIFIGPRHPQSSRSPTIAHYQIFKTEHL